MKNDTFDTFTSLVSKETPSPHLFQQPLLLYFTEFPTHPPIPFF